MKKGLTEYILTGKKGFIFFKWILTVILVFSCFPDESRAGKVMLGAQLKDIKAFSGDLSARFQRDFEATDLYVIAYVESEEFSIEENIFSLTPLSDGSHVTEWNRGISILSSYDSIEAGRWVTLPNVDFSPLKDTIADTIFMMVLVRSGENPLDSGNWMEITSTSLIMDPLARIPGQTQFLSNVVDGRNSPDYVDNGPVPVADLAAEEDAPKDDETDNDDGDVEKPDIYKISGNRLYYANGSADRFQVVDISLPDNPVMVHSQALENTPLDLYVENGYVMLLEQAGQRDEVSVTLKVFQDVGTEVREVARESYSGLYYLNSRKSGSRIFITATSATEVYPEFLDDVEPEKMEQGAVVMAVDIQNPEMPALLSKKTFAAYDADIYLDRNYLVQIARESWQNTVLHLFDLNNESDPLTPIAEVRIPGQVPSEYHVKISHDTLFVIYRDEDIQKGSSLKIFDLTTPGEVTEKGLVDAIAPGEELYAATFMDDRAYIVTYERTDPLWVVDISDHGAPKILGELEVPGWSEYIRFHNNRLIALGYDDSDGKRRVSIALFSVEDPFNPVLLDRVTPLKEVADYTTSVAISDDRGFYFNSASGVVLLPISYYDSGSSSGLEIVQIAPDYNTFQWDHFVRTRFNVQRGSEVDGSDDLVLSMGDAALNTIDISSADQPVIRGELRLAVNVEKIALLENSLILNGDNGGLNPGKKLFGVGGDYYLNTTSDLMLFGMENGQLQLESPVEIVDSQLLYPDLVVSDNLGGKGVLFSWNSSAFRCFDQQSMALGSVVKLDDNQNRMLSDPIYRNNLLYFAVGNYETPIDYMHDDGNVNAMSVKLKRYDCSNSDAPVKLPEFSIPGTPDALLDSGSMVCVERFDYYYPYPYPSPVLERDLPEGDDSDSLTDDLMVPEPDPFVPRDVDQGLRINIVDLSSEGAVLDVTAFFDQEKFGYSQIICDENKIYLVSWKQDVTDIRKLDPDTLGVIEHHTVEGRLSPVKASNARIVFTDNGSDPYWHGVRDIYMPYWNTREIRVFDFSQGVKKELLKVPTDYYLSKKNVEIGYNALYLADGYKGVLVLPFD